MTRKNDFSMVVADPAAQGGFTLIELIIVIVVLALSIGILIPFVVGLQGSADPILTQQAATLAQGEMEQVIATKRATGFASIPTGASACVEGMPTADFTCGRSVCYVPAGNFNDLTACATVTAYKRVDVTVTQTKVGPVSFATVVTNY